MKADLIAFLRARLDEDEATAKAAAKADPEETETSRWYGHAHWVARYGTVVDAEDDDFAMMYGSITNSTMETADHIARHDPARVLREVEAKRAILAHYLKAAGIEPDDWPEDPVYTNALLSALGHLMAIWSDHPDYPAARKALEGAFWTP